ncbi:MAG TPA: hypothetical protein VFP61_14540 [Acidimicrobiales bacterium]|nr:hypothetical protein [Acidimicrobiales bacterium]
MSLVPFLAVRAVAAGLLVVFFSLVGEVVRPKRFAGVFGAAPSVALANLGLVVGVEGSAKAATESGAMVAGGVAMVVACGVGVLAVRRLRALRGTLVMGAVWLAVAAAVLGIADVAGAR